MSKKIFIFMFLVLMLSLVLGGCKNNESPEKILEKTTKELGYFEERIFEIILKFQKNEYLKDGQQDWNKILDDTNKINIEIDNLTIDLSNLKMSNEEIRNLSKNTNDILIAINNKNENQIMNSLNNLYQTIPKYLEKTESDKMKLKQKELKAIILNSFNYAYKSDWINAKNEAINAENKYNDMISDNKYIEENSYNLNKIYILIQEYIIAVNSENFELARVKFINLTSEF